MPIEIADLTNVSEDAAHLADHLQGILDRVINTYESYNMPVPARCYWTVGQAVVDCEQIAVTLLQMYIGAPGDEATDPRRCSDPRSATVAVSVSRVVPIVGPGGKAPSASKIQDASVVAAYDAWILLESVRQFDTWEASGFGLGVIATVESPPPEGGFQTTILTMTSAVP